MPANARDAYLESRILSADPIELIRILYRIAIDRLTEARRRLAQGDILARSQAISQASEALGELAGSLNHEAGGAFSRRLAALYEYMQWRLVEANARQSEEPLKEVTALLATLLEAWQNVTPAPPPVESDLTTGDLLQLAAHTGTQPELAAEYAPQSWCG